MSDRRPATRGATGGGGEIRVLLVDDDSTWASSTGQLLEHQREPLQVTTATSLSAARARLDDAAYDCVVCDYQLESGTGLDLLESVREDDPELPFVLVTGQGDESVASDAIGRQVSDYIPKRSLGGRQDLLARRIETAVESHRTRQALDRVRRSREAMLDILTATSSREGLTCEFCNHLVETREYACAWVGTLDDSGGVVCQCVAGRDGYLDAVLDAGTRPDETEEPALVALTRDETQVVAPIPAGDGQDSERGHHEGNGWQTAARAHGFESAVAVPIEHEGTTLGVLAVYGESPVVETEQRELLAEYGDTIGYGLRSADWKESLLSAGPAAFDVTFTDESVPLVAVTRRLPDEAHLTVLTMALRAETLLYVLRTEHVSAAALRSLSAVDAVESVEVTTAGESLRCELAVGPRTPETLLAAHGARVVDVTAQAGQCSLTAHRRDSEPVRSLVETVRAAYPDCTVQSVRSVSGDRRRPDGSRFDELTDKQRRAVEMALYSGYFERPREHNTTEVADKLGVSRQTFTQHLRAGQRKLLTELLDGA